MTVSIETIAVLIQGSDGWEEIDPDCEVRRFAYRDLIVRVVEHEGGRVWGLENEDGGPPARSFTDVPSLYETLERLQAWHDTSGRDTPSP